MRQKIASLFGQAAPHDPLLKMDVRASKFRLDINALRALSVIGVLGYHLRIPGFAGGFVGVDVFFVITGYLMARNALTDLVADRFSLWGFGKRRLRRIYPALVVVVIASVVAGWFLTLPSEYLRHLRQACYSLTFLSNFAFDADNGYFASIAQTKPLLHTWSLSVEWQFYIWMPIAVWLIWGLKLPQSSKIVTIGIAFASVAVVSLAWCLWQYRNDAMGSAFFSLRARAWEPLTGCLIAIAEIKGSKWPQFYPRGTALAGWIFLGLCIVLPLPEAHWPGPITILPILGAGLIISEPKGIGDGPIRFYGIQRIGDWSYSIYLWHWPIWVFGTIWLNFHDYKINATIKTLMVISSLAIGAGSYYFVEQPASRSRYILTGNRLLAASTCAFLALLSFTLTAFLDEGFPSRLPDYLLAAEEARRTNTPRDECFRNSNSVKKAVDIYCNFGSNNAGRVSSILWGDSFANQYLEPIAAAAKLNGVRGLIATQSACRPFIDDDTHVSDQTQCRLFNRITNDFILNHVEPKIVIIGGNWSDARDVSNLVKELIGAKKTVVLIMPVLSVGFDVPKLWMERQIQLGQAIPEWKVDADPGMLRSNLRAGLKKIISEYTQLIVVDPLQVMCEGSQCWLVRHDQANFRDSVHISNVNAMQYEALFDTAFESALAAIEKRNTVN